MRLLAAANRRAGRAGAAILLDRLCGLLSSSGVRIEQREVEGPEQLKQLAQQAAADDWDGLVVCGGDGIVHWAVQGLAGSRTALAVLPCGRGNDLAANLGLPGSAQSCARTILCAHTVPLDLLSSPGGWIANVVGAGFDAEVNRLANRLPWPRGPAVYPIALIGVLARLRPRHFQVTADGERIWSGPAVVAVAANGPAYGGGIRIAPGARFDDGRLDLVLANAVGRLELLRMLPRLYRGTHIGHPAVLIRQARRVRIESDPPAPVYADGEPFGTTPLEIETVPAALRVFKPT
ncbi:MAG TPA: diacylglycerol kinase family protein [Acidobacteriota bacterium]